MPFKQGQQLTFLEDRVLLIIYLVGILFIVTTGLWVVRQSPKWRRMAVNRAEGEDHDDAVAGDGALLGARTRVVPGGRQATKAARKEAKKRAKEELKRSGQSSVGQERRNRLQNEQKKRKAEERSRLIASDPHGEEDSSTCLARKLERHIVDHKVSSLENLEDELGVSSAEIAAKIDELENAGLFTGVMVDDARGGRSFIRVTLDEMSAIASFINDKGRVTINELETECFTVLGLAGPPPQENIDGEGKDRGSTTPRRAHEDPSAGTVSICETKMCAKAPSAGQEEDVGRPASIDTDVSDGSTITAATAVVVEPLSTNNH